MRLIDADALEKAIIKLDLDNTNHWTVMHKIYNAPTIEPDANCSHCDYFKFSQLFVDNIAKLMADYNIETYDDLMNEINRVKDALNELGGRHG